MTRRAEPVELLVAKARAGFNATLDRVGIRLESPEGVFEFYMPAAEAEGLCVGIQRAVADLKARKAGAS